MKPLLLYPLFQIPFSQIPDLKSPFPIFTLIKLPSVEAADISNLGSVGNDISLVKRSIPVKS
jgi:hypothetical protein